MGTPSNRALLDRIGRQMADARERVAQAARASASATNPIGLRFQKGAGVLDLTTGVRGIVQLGERDPETRAERYRVQLVDARIVYRTDRELEPAPPSASKGE